MYANEQIGFSSGSDEYTVELAYLFTAIMYPRYIPCIFCVAGFHSGLWLVKLLDDYERAWTNFFWNVLDTQDFNKDMIGIRTFPKLKGILDELDLGDVLF